MSSLPQPKLDDLKRYAGNKYREYLKNEETDTLYSLANSIDSMAREQNSDASLQQIPYKIREAVMAKSNPQNPSWHFNNAVQLVTSLIHNCQSMDNVRGLLERIDPIAEENKRIQLFNLQLNETNQHRTDTITRLSEQLTQLIDQNTQLLREVCELKQMNVEQNHSLERIEEK